MWNSVKIHRILARIEMLPAGQGGPKSYCVVHVNFLKPYCANSHQILKSELTEHLEHGFVDFTPNICASKEQNHTFSAKV